MNSLGLDKPVSETRVVVAMSGGVDSSVTAALMHEAGYETIGVTLQLYDHGQAIGRSGSCCAGQDIYDARRVADRLGIPHYVLDYESRFRGQVMEEFADSYLAGETPIPCIRCNQTVKFTDLLQTAKDLGADAMATGHYVDRRDGSTGPELYRAADETRDQSYFLFATTRAQLQFLRFPLGAMHKDETRNHARRFGLDVAEKADSQDICFVPNGRYTDLLTKLRPGASDPGDIVDMSGAVIGRHDGIARYTVGQRRGIGIAAEQPLYVVAVDANSRRVVVGPKEALHRTRFEIGAVNWLGDTPLSFDGCKVQVKIRSTQEPVPATVYADHDDQAVVVLTKPQGAIAPGQACVIYHGERVLGGGWIRRLPAKATEAPTPDRDKKTLATLSGS